MQVYKCIIVWSNIENGVVIAKNYIAEKQNTNKKRFTLTLK